MWPRWQGTCPQRGTTMSQATLPSAIPPHSFPSPPQLHLAANCSSIRVLQVPGLLLAHDQLSLQMPSCTTPISGTHCYCPSHGREDPSPSARYTSCFHWISSQALSDDFVQHHLQMMRLHRCCCCYSLTRISPWPCVRMGISSGAAPGSKP